MAMSTRTSAFVDSGFGHRLGCFAHFPGSVDDSRAFAKPDAQSAVPDLNLAHGCIADAVKECPGEDC